MSEDILSTLMNDIKTAMKAGEKDTVTALRGLHAQIKDATVNAGKDVTVDAITAVVNKAIKQRQDSVELYTKGNRPELAVKEEAEIALLKKYQPAQLSEAEVTAIVKEVIAATGATSKKEIGKVMGALMPRVKGKADGKLINQIVQASLS